MRATKVCLMVLLLALVYPACTGNELDDADSADVIMLITSMESPSIRAQRQTSTDGQCLDPSGGGSGTLCQSSADCGNLTESCVRVDVCILEVEDWTATILAAPKNSLAATPFNDIVMDSVDITYDWVNDALDGIIPPQPIGLGNVTIPTNGQNSVTFPPIPSDPLNTTSGPTPFEGATANMTLTFNAFTVEGTRIQQTAQRQLIIEICR